MGKRLGLRGRLTAVVMIAAVVTLAALVAGFNLALRASLHHDADQVLAERAASAIDAVKVRGGQIRAVEAPDQGAVDAQTWVYAGSHALERPPAPPAVQREANQLAGGPRRYLDEPTTDTRLYAVPVVSGGSRAGTVVVGLDLEPYERTASRAFLASLIFAAVVLVLMALTVRWVIGRALRPVAQMTANAEAWTEHDLDHRFGAGEPHDELTQLAATFDRMLARLAASLRREQLFSAEVSHELRTPLSAIVAEAELALRRKRTPDDYRGALTEIADRARQLERTLETLLTAARSESELGRGSADAASVAEYAIESCAALAAARGIDVELTKPRTPVRVGVDRDAAERVLAPVLENACRYARSRASVEVSATNGTVEFTVSDDGPGVAPSERDRVFEPGERGGAAENANGAGLGLSLSRRLAVALGGQVDNLESDSGARFRIRIPLG
jgi:two-component system heavy metal sensor histidine kinase CusS